MKRTKHGGVLATLTAHRRHLVGAITMAVVAAAFTLGAAPAANADTNTITFEPPTYLPGSIQGQDGWGGSGIPINPLIDQAVVLNSAYPSADTSSFASQSFRMSNAYTTGSFGDQVFSPSLTDRAGETSSASDGFADGTRQTRFVAQWQFASATGAVQPGLSTVVSPDRGDGARMSWIQMTDSGGTGLEVNFADYQHSIGDFVTTNVASGLSRTEAHTITVQMDFVDGIANDVVRVYVDSVLVHTGTSWEDYYRDVESNPTRPVDSLLFRVGGADAPATSGNGFLFDNVELASSMTPDMLGACPVSITVGTPTVYTLLANCYTDQTIVVPQNVGGSVFNGDSHSITGVDPTPGHFLGAVVQAEAGSNTIIVKNLTVTVANLTDACDDGANRLRGILYDGVSGTIKNNTVTNLEQGPIGESGCQEGNAIDVRNTAGTTPKPNVTIDNNTVTDYQKTGIIATLSTVATITDNTVTGDGPITYIAQNGIQVSFKATAKLVGNNVSHNNYSPAKVVACGLLIYKAGGVSGATKSGIAQVKADNHFHDNEQNVCNFGKGGTFSPTS